MIIADEPRMRLRDILLKYGKATIDDPQRCEGLLRDLCGPHRKEVNVLVAALREGIPTELAFPGSEAAAIPEPILIRRLSKRLEENRGTKESLARWAVESWAFALGRIPEAGLSRDTAGGARPIGPDSRPSPTDGSTRLRSSSTEPASIAPPKRRSGGAPQVAVPAYSPRRNNRSGRITRFGWSLVAAAAMAAVLFASAGLLIWRNGTTGSGGGLVIRSDPPPPPTKIGRGPISPAISLAEARRFVEAFTSAANLGLAEQLLPFYCDRVDYYSAGVVGKAHILADKREYYSRWPEVQNRLSGQCELRPSSDPDAATVVFMTDFVVRSPQRRQEISGSARTTVKLRRVGRQLGIFDEKQSVLTRKKKSF